MSQEFPVNEGGTSRKVTILQVGALFGNVLDNQSTADQTVNASTTAYLTGSSIVVPVGKLAIGTRFTYRLVVSKTNAGTAANSFHFRVGVNGTTGDAAVLTFTMPVGTAAVDVALIDITVTIRGPLSASCLAHGNFRLTHNLQITGFSTIPCLAISVLSAGFDATVANLICGLSVTTATSTVFTFQQVIAEARNL
jgi:hypothetical protein